MKNLLKASVGFSAGWTAAMVVSLCCSIAVFPEHLQVPTLFGLSHLALSGALDGAALPLFVTWLVSLRYTLSPRAVTLMSVGVVCPILSWRLYRVWDNYGAFPDWMPQLELLVLLPTCIAAGYVFGFVFN